MKMRSFCSDGERETVEEEEKVNHENTNGAFSSSSPRFEFDLNETPPSDSESEEPPQQNPSCSSTLLVQHDIPPNPNPQTSPSSEKRPLVQNRRSRESKKAKKRKLEQPEAVLEVVSPPKWLDQVMKTMEETKAPHHRISKAPLACEDAKLIFEKDLSVSDVNPGQSRFLMPFNQLKRNDFLTQMESRILEKEKDEKGKKPGLKAILVNEKAGKWSVVLKIYEMKKKKNNNSENGSLNYALNSGWNDVVKGIGLKANDKISLWSFRFEEVLYFALGTV